MTNSEIETEFLKDFNYLEKDKYKWKIEHIHRDGKTRKMFSGKNKNNINDYIYVKQIIISPLTYKKILREIYFSLLVKNQNFFIELNDMRINKEKQKAFLLFKGNYVNLHQFINLTNFNYLSDKGLIKWIIFQITFGLYLLHYNNIIHNDIKPSNILIDEVGGIHICDLGSATYEKEIIHEFSSSYIAPEFLYGNSISNEKLDMWGLGVIMLELFLKTNEIFKVESQDTNNKNQLEFILSKFGINQCMFKEEIDKLFNDENNPKCIILDETQIEKIKDENAIDLIRHLLILNPKHRYSAEQVLQSKYLQEYLGLNLKIKKIQNPINYNILSDNMNRDSFLENYEKLNSALKN